MYAFSSPSFWVRFFREFRCPQCGGREGYASRPRNLFEKFPLRWMFLGTARCGDCYRRAYVPVSVPLLPRPQPLNFDPEKMLASTLSAERKVPGEETRPRESDNQRIA